MKNVFECSICKEIKDLESLSNYIKHGAQWICDICSDKLLYDLRKKNKDEFGNIIEPTTN